MNFARQLKLGAIKTKVFIVRVWTEFLVRQNIVFDNKEFDTFNYKKTQQKIEGSFLWQFYYKLLDKFYYSY